MKKNLYILLILTIFLAACGSSSSTGPGTINITITPSPLIINSTDDKKLSTLLIINAVNSDGSSTQVLPEQCQWIVSDVSIITITNFSIKGISKGTTTVDCTFNGNSKTLIVNVL